MLIQLASLGNGGLAELQLGMPTWLWHPTPPRWQTLDQTGCLHQGNEVIVSTLLEDSPTAHAKSWIYRFEESKRACIVFYYLLHLRYFCRLLDKDPLERRIDNAKASLLSDCKTSSSLDEEPTAWPRAHRLRQTWARTLASAVAELPGSILSGRRLLREQ